MLARQRAYSLLSLAIALLGLGASPAWSLGIGEWHALSYMGEPVRAEAEIYSEPGQIVDTDCFRLLHPGANADFPPVEEARLSIRTGAKGMRLRIESSRPVNDPIAQMRLKITCGAQQTRDLVLLFSPREYADTPQVLPAAQTNGARAESANAESKGKLAQASSQTTGKSSASTPKPKMRAASGTSASTTAKPAPKPRAGTVTGSGQPKLVLSSELDPEIVNRLRLSAELRQVPRQATEAEREQLRRLYRSMMEIADLKEAPSKGAPGAATPPVTPPESAPGATPATPPTPAPDGATAPATTPVPAPPPAIADQPKATPLPPLNSLNAWWQPLLLLLLLALLLGLILWLMRRRRSHRQPPDTIEPMPPVQHASIKSEAAKDGGSQDTLESLLKREPAEAAGTTAESATSSAFANVHGVTVHAESPAFLTSYRTMLDLADSMMAFGLVTDAADALKEYVEDHPDVAVGPWLKLLDILRHNGKRADFDLYSQKLKQHFNLDLPAWDAPASLAASDQDGATTTASDDLEARFRAAPSPLEAFPHVRDRLVSMWGKADCAGFLQHLMRDNRAGKRRGFPLIVIDDILLLLDITQELTGIDSETSIANNPEIFSDTW